jgi:branched-chain amino acid transport system substrate-binding protein
MKPHFFCIVFATLLGCGAVPPASGADSASPGVYADRIVLGQSAKLAGAGGTQAGAQFRDGLNLAFEAANAAGGVHGRRIELVSLDDGNKDGMTAANTRFLIDKHHAFALVGYTFTASVKAALPIVREHNIPLIAPYTGFAELYDGSQPNVFMFRASFEDELATLIRHIDTVAFQRVALLHYNTPVGAELKRDVIRNLKKVGRDLMASASMQINSDDSTQAVRAAAAALAGNCPNVLILGVAGKDAAAAVRALKGNGCMSIQYLARGLVDINVLVRELGDDARGIMVSQLVPNPFRKTVHPLVLEYQQRLSQRKAPSAPDFVEFEGFIAGKFVLQALRRAGGNLDRKSFVQALEAERLDGPGHYRLQFGPNKRVGTQYVNFVMISDHGRIVD